MAAPSDEQIKERIQDIVLPATLAQVSYFHRLGLRERKLSFVMMVAFVLEMIWRQIGSVNALTRIVQKEAILWEQPRKVSQQAMSQRLTSLPSELFLRVLMDILPIMRDRWMERERPLPAELKWVAERYRAILAVDESTLYALIRKIGLLKDLPENPLAGRMTAFFKRRFGETAKKAKQMMTELSKTVGVAFHGKRGSVPSVYREGNTNQRLVEPRPTKGV